MGIYKDTKIEWPVGSISNTFNLNVPLQQVRPGRGAKIHQKWSEDRKTRETIRVGSGVYDVVVELRYESDVSTLMDMLIAGIEEDKQLRYHDPNGNTHDFRIVEPRQIQEVGFDDLQQTEDWHQIQLRLRKTDGSRWTGIF